MGPSDLSHDRLATLISGRNLTVVDERTLVLEVVLRAPLPPDLSSAVAKEAKALSSRRGAGLYVPGRLEAGDGTVRLTLDPFDRRALRLDRILVALKAAGTPFGSPMSALLAGATASRLRALHASGGSDGDLSPRHVLIGPGGGVALIAPGLPHMRALMVSPETEPARLRRRAPELLQGAPRSPRADVYALAALYYELLTGEPYRGETSPTALRSAARAGLDAELPGALPDPRPSLVQLLRDALSPRPGERPADAARFLQRLESELQDAKIPLADRGTVASLLAEYVPEVTPRGPTSLVDGVATAVVSEPIGASRSAWADVLGDPAAPPENEEPTRTETDLGVPPAVAENRGLSLPLPSAPSGSEEAPPPSSPLSTRAGIRSLSRLDVPRVARPPTLDSAARLSPKAILAGVGALGVLVAGLTGLAALRGAFSEPAPPIDRSLIPNLDAGASTTLAAPNPPTTPRQRRPDAGASVKSLGLVSIMSNPSGAEVLIDGGYVGKTPLVLKHPVRRGQVYRIELSVEGYLPRTEVVRARSDSINLVVRLDPSE
ncbi:MAG: PEGA domain-containing protein [Myxococcota bacterium]